ncbi:MAG: hypothetical protein KKD18_02090, partial [Nanoarchaeota archaeon]|nr:hypothetical protein [Nanoarchaeota archaeon]
MEVIHEESVTVLQDYEAYLNGFNSYCSDTYRASLGSRRYDSNNYGETYGWTYCRVYGDIGIYPHRLGAKFGEFFSDNYDEASSNVDLLSGSYTSFVPRDPILVDDAERFRDQVV